MGLKERRQREKEERKNQILDAARALLFKKGLNGTSINQIAKSAELGVGTIYFYYKNKEELFSALQQEGLFLLHLKIKESFSRTKDPGEQLKGIAQTYLRFSEENKDYFDIINYFLSSPEVFFSPDLKDEVDEQGNQILWFVEKAIEQGMAQGTFHKVDAKKHSIMLWGALHGLIQFKKLRNTILQGEDHKEVYNYAVDSLISNLSLSRF